MKKLKILAAFLLLVTIIIGIVSGAKLVSSSGTTSSRPDVTDAMLFSEGKGYVDDSKYAEAIVVLEQISADYEAYADARHLLAESYQGLSYNDKYEEILNELTSLEDNEQNWIDLVYLYISEKEFDKAKDVVSDRRGSSQNEEYEYLWGEMNPAAPEFSLPGGTYGDYQMLTLKENTDNENTVHYSTGDMEVSVNSPVFERYIVSEPEVQINAISVSALGYTSEAVHVSFVITKEVEEIPERLDNYRKDEGNLGHRIKMSILDKDSDSPMYNYELAKITELLFWGDYYCEGALNDCNYIFSDGGYKYNPSGSLDDDYGRISLELLGYMPYLETLYIGYQEKLDIEPICNLSYLKNLSLLNDGIEDISVLGSMTGLEQLALGWNEISDVTVLRNMTELTSLGLWNNNISDISALSNISKLRYFDIANNQIQDIGIVSNMPELEEFWCNNNNITDYSPLNNCNKVVTFMQQGNPVSNYGSMREKTADLFSTDMQ